MLAIALVKASASHQAFEPNAGVERANGASALTGTLELLQKLHFFFRQNHFVSFVSDIGRKASLARAILSLLLLQLK
jgi:hypothetical protein